MDISINDQLEDETTFYCVFCKNVKGNCEHGGHTKVSHDDICQSCLKSDSPSRPQSLPAVLDSLDQTVLRVMIFRNWESFVAACGEHEGYDPHKLFAKVGGHRDSEDA